MNSVWPRQMSGHTFLDFLFTNSIDTMMSKINEIQTLIQKVCDFSVKLEDLADLQIDSTDKQFIVDTVNAAKCAKELQRMKDIIKKVEAGETFIQGGMG